MAVLENIEPKNVFRFFEEISAIPHGSGNTDKISDYLVQFALGRRLEHYCDDMGNVIIISEAAKGYENEEPMILQGHMDMVCEKASWCDKDMKTEGLDLETDGESIYAKGTTLGSDDGIAVAMMLAVMDDDSIEHPRIEAVITVDEEVGMTGAAAIDVSMLRGKRMINIDSETEGIFTVSCAGGNITKCIIPVKREPFDGKGAFLTVSGLNGGHSGAEIDKGRANADILLGRLLCEIAETADIRIVSVSGGLKDNAIPTESNAVIMVNDMIAVKNAAEKMLNDFRNEYSVTDSEISVCVSECDGQIPVDMESTRKIISFLICAPNGVREMSADIKGLVQTSLNLGILKSNRDYIEASFCVRSCIDSQKKMLVNSLRCLTENLGGEISVSGDYPGWAYKKNSRLRADMTEAFFRLYGYEPQTEAIHAGVECGLFAGKIDGLDCVSIGPDLTEIHTYREKMHIASVQRTWELVLNTLKIKQN